MPRSLSPVKTDAQIAITYTQRARARTAVENTRTTLAAELWPAQQQTRSVAAELTTRVCLTLLAVDLAQAHHLTCK